MKLKREPIKHITAAPLYIFISICMHIPVASFTVFVINLRFSWIKFPRDIKGRGEQSETCPERWNVVYGFGLHPRFIFADLKSDNVLQKNRKLCKRLRWQAVKSGGMIRKRNAPWEQNVERQIGGNIEQEKRECERESCWLLSTSVSEWKQGQRIGGGQKERQKKDWIDVSANVK